MYIGRYRYIYKHIYWQKSDTFFVFSLGYFILHEQAPYHVNYDNIDASSIEFTDRWA